MNKQKNNHKKKKTKYVLKSSIGDLIDDGNRDQFPQFGKVPKKLSEFL